MKRIISIAILAIIIACDVAVASTSGKSGKSGSSTPHYLFNDCDTIKRTYTLDARGYAVYPDGRRELVKGSINNRHRRRILQGVVKKEKAATTEKKEKSATSKAEKAVVVEETKYGKSCKSKKAKSAKAKSAKAKSAKKGGSAKANKNKTTSGAGATGTAAGAASGSAASSTSEYVDYTDETVTVVEEPWVEDGDAGKDSDKNINGAKDGTTIQASENQMSPVGISLLTIGLVAIVALGTMFLIAKNRSAESYSEFEDEDGDFDDKRTETMSENDGKRAYVMGEEGSVYTSATHDTRFIPGVAMAGAEMGNGNDDSNQVDVHHCTSAMCPICNGKETVFINALDDESQEPEGYEIYDNGEKIGTRTRSDVTPPSFDNPAEIERPYVVDNTIDF